MPLDPRKLVHICLSDTGWILERLAREIAERLPYVSYDMHPDGAARIQYYMTYGCRRQRVSPTEIALFTHKEDVAGAAIMFEEVARDVDFCVAMSDPTARILGDAGVGKVGVISPGVDLERFTPKLRIGVVGRTYHTGRKGESLVASVMDIPEIEWVFTGQGWPGPARFVPEEEMPAFYRSLDYVLVPSLIEGGPMCVLEALACGCQVIASPVGWVPQFEHIEFKRGDAADLRKVLLKVVEERAARHRSVAAYTWQAWADRHHELFVRLLGHDPLHDADHASNPAADALTLPGDALRVAICVHGSEMIGSLGGPSVRAPRTAVALKRIGVDASFQPTRAFASEKLDLVHVFNVWPPAECEILLRQAEKNHRPAVLSPIFLDLSERKFFNGELLEILGRDADDAQIALALAPMRERIALHKSAAETDREPLPGYFSNIRRLSTYASHLILLSQVEKDALQRIGVNHPSASIVKNPVDAQLYASGDPGLFRERFGVSDYVLCLGRIEARKNQAMLALALRNLDIPVVFVGHEPDPAYAALVRKWAGKNVLFAGRIEPSSALLISALAGARVFCLPSWSEGAPLSALEAAAAGCNMVLSNRASEKEYFGDLARYVDPADPEALREQIVASFDENRPAARSAALRELVVQQHRWETYARGTLDAYRAARAVYSAKQAGSRSPDTGRIFVDLTTLAHHKGTPTGMARVEERISSALAALESKPVQFIYWDSTTRRFVHLDDEVVRNRDVNPGSLIAASTLGQDDKTCLAGDLDLSPDDHLVILGSAWMRNRNYLRDVSTVKWVTGVRLSVAVYDVIQWKFKSWYPKKVTDEFCENCLRFIDVADQVLACSQQTSDDLAQFLAENKVAIPPIRTFRLGDETGNFTSSEQVQFDKMQPLEGQRFVLYVSTIDFRKNHIMLFELWRRLVAEYGAKAPLLVLVGSKGWRGEEAMDVLDSEAVLRGRVHLLHDVNDATLKRLYQTCLFTVYPSRYEGWGLPVAESLRLGKFCLSSDGGSLVEIAPEFVEHLNPLDFVGWYRALVKYCFSPDLVAARTARLREYVSTDWRDVALEILAQVRECRGTRRLPAVRTDIPVRFAGNGQAEAASPYLLGGWSEKEAGGTWTVGTRTLLGFQLERQPLVPLILQIEASGFVPDGDATEVVVCANGATLSRWTLGAEIGLHLAVIPPELVGENQTLNLEFQVMNPRAPAAFAQSADTRLLGLRVVSLLLSERMQRLPIDKWCDARLERQWIVQCANPAESQFLGFAFDTPSPTTLTIAINGRDRASFAVKKTQHGAKVVRLKLTDDPVHIAVRSTAGDIRVMRLGCFSVPPREALENAIRRRPAAGNAHARHAGALPAIDIGSRMTFRKGSECLRGLAGGWNAPEEVGVWTNGAPASVHLRVPGVAGLSLRLVLEFDCYPWLLELGTEFTVSIGSAPAAPLLRLHDSRTAEGHFRKEFLVLSKQALDAQGRLSITFRSQGAIAPIDLGDSADSRPLAIRVLGLTVDRSGDSLQLERNVPVRVNQELGAVQNFAGGWHGLETDGMWSNGESSFIALRIPARKAGAARLELDLSTIQPVCADGHIDIRVSCNEALVDTLRIKPDGVEQKTVSIPADILARDGDDLVISLACDRSVRPSAVDYSPDLRTLSFKLHSIALIDS